MAHIAKMSPDDLFDVIEDHAEEGVDFVTVHCGLTRKAVERLQGEGTILDIVSRGGSFLLEWAAAALLSARAAARRSWPAAAAAGVALATCALLRPEGHLVALLLVLLAPRALPFLLLLLVPYHLWRVATYGEWLPNTFYIKGHADTLLGGLKYPGSSPCSMVMGS